MTGLVRANCAFVVARASGRLQIRQRSIQCSVISVRQSQGGELHFQFRRFALLLRALHVRHATLNDAALRRQQQTGLRIDRIDER